LLERFPRPLRQPRLIGVYHVQRALPAPLGKTRKSPLPVLEACPRVHLIVSGTGTPGKASIAFYQRLLSCPGRKFPFLCTKPSCLQAIFGFHPFSGPLRLFPSPA